MIKIANTPIYNAMILILLHFSRYFCFSEKAYGYHDFKKEKWLEKTTAELNKGVKIL